MPRGPRFEPESPPGERSDPVTEIRERFLERVTLGRYDTLLDDSVRNVLHEAAAIRGLDEELGAIRFALAKLLAEELDANKLAMGVARLTSAATQVVKLDQSLGDAAEASLAAALDEILGEFGS